MAPLATDAEKMADMRKRALERMHKSPPPQLKVCLCKQTRFSVIGLHCGSCTGADAQC